ncbi:MAG: hypothetical protein J6P44_09425 [Bacteroidales bacterium]|nr:hypothetical protein [Bacteroidales bacterium]
MKTKIIFTLLLLMLVNCHVKAQKQYFQIIEGDIKVIKIQNTHAKCYIEVKSSLTSNEVSLSFPPQQSLVTMIGDTMIVEESNQTNQTAQEIHIKVKEGTLKYVKLSSDTKAQMSIDGQMQTLYYRGEQNSQFELKNTQDVPLEVFEAFVDTNAVFKVTDSLTVGHYMYVVVKDGGRMELNKLSSPKYYCKIKSRPEGVIINNKQWNSYPRLIRDENNLPLSWESLWIYYDISLFAGKLTNKTDYLGDSWTYGFSWDFMLQYNFAYQNAVLLGFGMGWQISVFDAGGYGQSHGVSAKENLSLNYSYSTWRLPMMYRRYFDDNIKSPSVDLGMIFRWNFDARWEENRSRHISNEVMYKSDVEFRDIMRKFQLDAYFGLNLGRKFTVYGTFGLLPVTESGSFGNMRSVNVGIKYRWDMIGNWFDLFTD